MYRTITANPMLTVQGAFLVIAQEDTKDVTKKRYAIINSDTLEIRKSFEGATAKADLGAEIRVIEAEKAATEPGSLANLMAAVSSPAPKRGVIANDTKQL
jgi:hypothetical protein